MGVDTTAEGDPMLEIALATIDAVAIPNFCDFFRGSKLAVIGHPEQQPQRHMGW
jgi:hypothetical protein